MSMNRPVGYLVNYHDGLQGVRGTFYDYVVAENGVFIEAEGPLLAARVPVAPGQIRGLAPVKPAVVLRNGKVSKHFFDLALNTMLTTPDKERYVAVTWNNGYHITVPNQAPDTKQLDEGIDADHGSAARVAYLRPDSVLLDIHTHPKMSAAFSHTDNRDEAGMKLYGVIGHCGTYQEITADMDHETVMGWLQNNCPAVRLRVGVYGYFYPIAWKDVFDGDLGPEMFDLGEEEIRLASAFMEFSEGKEVIVEDELYSAVSGQYVSPENSRGWLRWDRWFRRRGPVPAIGR